MIPPEVVLLFYALAVVSSQAADWPQWLGAGRDGSSAEVGLPAVWAKDGPRELWRKPAGKGISQVSVAGGVAYTLYDDAGGEHLIALDAGTGALRWSARLDAPYIDQMGFHGPRATPTVAGDRLINLTARGSLVASATADGKLLWSIDLVAGLGGARPTWGYSGSPLVSDGRVYVGVGGPEGQGVAAFSLADGRELWHVGAWGAAYSSPVRTKLGGVDQVVFFTAAGPVGLTPDAGALVWEAPWKTSYDVNAATPLVLGGDRLFVASGYGNGGAVLQVGSGGATELWRGKSTKNKMATSVLHQGTLYGFSEDRLSAVDAATGATVWEQLGFGYGTVMLVDGHLVVAAEDGRVGVSPATRAGFSAVGITYQILHDKHCWTAPSLSNGVLYLRDNTDVVALDVRPL